jgi:hypothetical protein
MRTPKATPSGNGWAFATSFRDGAVRRADRSARGVHRGAHATSRGMLGWESRRTKRERATKNASGFCSKTYPCETRTSSAAVGLSPANSHGVSICSLRRSMDTPASRSSTQPTARFSCALFAGRPHGSTGAKRGRLPAGMGSPPSSHGRPWLPECMYVRRRHLTQSVRGATRLTHLCYELRSTSTRRRPTWAASASGGARDGSARRVSPRSMNYGAPRPRATPRLHVPPPSSTRTWDISAPNP